MNHQGKKIDSLLKNIESNIPTWENLAFVETSKGRLLAKLVSYLLSRQILIKIAIPL